ncbi:solute carrier family 23 protein [Neptunomonas phycophila]|jgi:xanthine/uracil/vitamin C permease (AzgA family)|uniref:Solute carrier family 23 protein n=1 Tax=Neptunomonas phycophila TaxID=1572645 RepID=A0ABT9ERC3_9GAMM|nr:MULTISPECIES: solute carrier family 23 protein [Neptunomonas]MBT3146955.1 xanthine/uracil/vitamin C permease [Neptunomonas phycophila]MDN2661305.1 xanthine/uracil/vitamin C permease [Neptunomonas sp. CHC150]MDO6467598.1 solute carrier family 23 protein [Neptunomonas phycophila]MDO6783586.1 solute carrier family 23 protein [Neptunomonas phycophila]MDP2521616.1 solute carrier family 23 protein [Neptunomonas phycophila]
MSIINRKHGEEQPCWPLGPFRIRLPFIHYRWEYPEMIQGLIMFVVGLAMIPLLEKYLGMPYEAALAFTFVAGVGYILPALLGVPLVPGWITPAIPVVLLYLKGFEPGPEAIKALFALQIEVSLIFLILGMTRLGSKLVEVIPNSLKSGIIIGAGIAALMGELKTGGRVDITPISLLIGSIISAYILFSLSFKNVVNESSLAKRIANFGMVPGMIIAMIIGWVSGEYPLPDIEWGITQPDFGLMFQYLTFTVGFPGWDVFLLAIPTAIIAYVIAFGDIIVGFTLVKRVDHLREDEKIEANVDRVHTVTALRNFIHAFLAPWPGLAGPLWTAAHATVTERYAMGRKAMDSIYSGGATFWMTGLVALFILPLVTLFKPVLPIALSLTLILTAYICIMVGMEQLRNPTERGVAGIVAVTLAMPDPKSTVYAVVIGLVLYFLIERPKLLGKHRPEDELVFADPPEKSAE